MIESVEAYLGSLRSELAGSDRAIVQDALSDAEEHLRNALEQQAQTGQAISESEALASIIAKYGTPEEIAAAYREIEDRLKPTLDATTAHGPQAVLTRFISVIAEPRAWGALLYMFFSIISGMLYFTWAVTGLSLSVGLIILIVGIPFIVLFLLSIRTISLVEGRVVEALLGVRMPRRSFFTPSNHGWWERLKSLFVERRTWGALVYMLFQLPLGIAYFTVFTILIATSAALAIGPFIPGGFTINIDNVAYQPADWSLPLVILGGVALFLITMHLAKLIGRLHGSLAKALLLGA